VEAFILSPVIQLIQLISILFYEHECIPTDNNTIGIYRENGDIIAGLKIVWYIVAIWACL